MISFSEFLTEISANPEFANQLNGDNTSSFRTSSKLAPNTNDFNIIPVKLTNSVYNIFKRYISSKYKLAENLLDRRGNSVNLVTINASNEELANLKELAEYISKNAPENTDGETANELIKQINDMMSGSERASNV